MSGWDRFQPSRSRLARNPTNMDQRTVSCTITLGRVQPQAPSHRTIYCNDRGDANLVLRFMVLPSYSVRSPVCVSIFKIIGIFFGLSFDFQDYRDRNLRKLSQNMVYYCSVKIRMKFNMKLHI
ncbi:hypothetical protein SLE2022_209090 [Rubroshorea leprosula]